MRRAASLVAVFSLLAVSCSDDRAEVVDEPLTQNQEVLRDAYESAVVVESFDEYFAAAEAFDRGEIAWPRATVDEFSDVFPDERDLPEWSATRLDVASPVRTEDGVHHDYFCPAGADAAEFDEWLIATRSYRQSTQEQAVTVRAGDLCNADEAIAVMARVEAGDDDVPGFAVSVDVIVIDVDVPLADSVSGFQQTFGEGSDALTRVVLIGRVDRTVFHVSTAGAGEVEQAAAAENFAEIVAGRIRAAG